jgi:hypothetical protein
VDLAQWLNGLLPVIHPAAVASILLCLGLSLKARDFATPPGDSAVPGRDRQPTAPPAANRLRLMWVPAGGYVPLVRCRGERRSTAPADGRLIPYV